MPMRAAYCALLNCEEPESFQRLQNYLRRHGLKHCLLILPLALFVVYTASVTAVRISFESFPLTHGGSVG